MLRLMELGAVGKGPPCTRTCSSPCHVGCSRQCHPLGLGKSWSLQSSPRLCVCSPLRAPAPALVLQGLSFPSERGFLATAAPHISTASMMVWRSRPLSLPGAEHIVSAASPAQFPASDIELCMAPVLLEGPETLPAVSTARGSGKHCKYLKIIFFFLYLFSTVFHVERSNLPRCVRVILIHASAGAAAGVCCVSLRK